MEPPRFYRPLKRLGQNFLQDPKIATQIVELAQLSRGDTVLEPGAGHGTLTELLQRTAGRIVAVEKDPRLASLLRARFASNPSVEVIEGDVLKIFLPHFNKVVGTPPYNISSRLVLFLISKSFESSYLVLQREFGQRLLALKGTADYGRLSVTAQRNLNIMPLLEIPRGAFYPKPKVDSLLLKFSPKASDVELDSLVFDELLRGIFGQRRRLLRSSLTHYLAKKHGKTKAREIVGNMALPSTRVYQLSITDLESLCVQLSKATGEAVRE